MHDYLKTIVENKEKEIHALRQKLTSTRYSVYSGKKSFKQALQKGGVIAEIKRKSPSVSHIGEIPNPTQLAQQYVAGGAVAISVLTDSFGFNGSIEDLKQVVKSLEHSSCPVLRKDFILDPVQIIESIEAGADAILLIVAALKEKTKSLLEFAKQLKIDALVEVNDEAECDYAVSIGAEIIGVNNRNLTTFTVDPDCALKLINRFPDNIVKVAASGMHSPEEVVKYLRVGYDAVLIGEALVKSKDPADFIKRIGAFRE